MGAIWVVEPDGDGEMRLAAEPVRYFAADDAQGDSPEGRLDAVLTVPRRPGAGAVKCAKAVGNLSERRGQMRYGEYRSHGLPIGSGRVEAACTTVVERRMKRTGMRWTVAGANPCSGCAAPGSAAGSTTTGTPPQAGTVRRWRSLTQDSLHTRVFVRMSKCCRVAEVG